MAITGKPFIESYNDKDDVYTPSYPPEKTGNSANTIRAAKKDDEDISQVNTYFNPSDFTLYCAKINNSVPFNTFTKGHNEALKKLGGTLLKDSTTSNGVTSSKITTANHYYQSYNEYKLGKVKGGGRTVGNYFRAHAKNGINTVAYTLNTPAANAMLLPNCIGAVRARYQELASAYNSDLGGNLTWSIPNGDPVNFLSFEPFNKTPNTEIVPGSNFKLWKDTNGTYGPIGGLWGKYKSKTGAPPLPGCILVWPNEVHVAFCEAIYRYGTGEEYIITTESAQNQFSSGYFWLQKRDKPYKYYGESPYFLYTPLCSYSALDSIQYNSEGTIENPDEVYNPNASLDLNGVLSGKNLENYDKMISYLKDPGLYITEGSKVEIQWSGNTKKDGSGTQVYKLWMTGYVRKIHDSGLPFPYEVVDKPANGSLIGYYDKRSLKLRG